MLHADLKMGGMLLEVKGILAEAVEYSADSGCPLWKEEDLCVCHV